MDKHVFTKGAAAAALGLGVLLAGCGGGGDGTGGSDGALPPASPPPTVADPTGDCGVPNFQADALAQVNLFRSRARTCGETSYPAVPALTWNATLAQAAHAHSADMATRNYVDHTSLDGRTFDQRITAAGYVWSSVAENIAAGPTTMTAVMAGWQNSPGHCRNLMNASLREVGLSCRKGAAGSTYATYWTMALGAPR